MSVADEEKWDILTDERVDMLNKARAEKLAEQASSKTFLSKLAAVRL